MRYKIIITMLIFTVSSYAFGNNDNEMKCIIKKMQQIDNKTQAEAEELVNDIKIRKSEILEEQGNMLNVHDLYNPDSKASADKMQDSKSDFIIFISSSIPLETLRNYVMDAPKNTTFILNGVIGEDQTKLQPTIKFIKLVMCGTEDITDNTNCRNLRIDINPELFELFNVFAVPAFVQPDRSLFDVHESKSTGTYKIIKGAVSISYVLEKFGGGK